MFWTGSLENLTGIYSKEGLGEARVLPACPDAPSSPLLHQYRIQKSCQASWLLNGAVYGLEPPSDEVERATSPGFILTTITSLSQRLHVVANRQGVHKVPHVSRTAPVSHVW